MSLKDKLSLVREYVFPTIEENEFQIYRRKLDLVNEEDLLKSYFSSIIMPLRWEVSLCLIVLLVYGSKITVEKMDEYKIEHSNITYEQK